MPSHIIDKPTSIEQSTKMLQRIILSIVDYGNQAVDILPSETLASFPSQADIPIILQQLEGEAPPDKLIKAWFKSLTSIKQDICHRCILHLKGLKSFREAFTDPLAATYPWFSKTDDCISILETLDLNEFGDIEHQPLTQGILAYHACVQAAYKEELSAIAERKKILHYSKNLSYLKEIVGLCGGVLSTQQALLDKIDQLGSRNTTHPDESLSIIKDLDYLIWSVQKQLLMRWRQLFNNPEIELCYQQVMRHTILPATTFLTLAKQYTIEDCAAIDYHIGAIKKKHTELEESFEKLTSLHCYAIENELSSATFNKKMQGFMSEQVELIEELPHFTHTTPLKTLRLHLKKLDELTQQIMPLKKELAKRCISTWHREVLSVCSLEQTPAVQAELKPIKTACSLEEALAQVKAHALESDTFKIAKTFFPDEIAILEERFSQKISEKNVLIDTIDQYYRYMRLAAFTQQNLKDYPDFKAIVTENTWFYQKLNLKTLETIRRRYREIKEKYSNLLRAPHLFDSYRDDMIHHEKSDTKSTSDITSQPHEKSILTSLIPKLTETVCTKQVEIKAFFSLLQEPGLHDKLDIKNVVQLKKTGELSLEYLLNTLERLAKIESSLEENDIEQAKAHAVYAKHYVSLVEEKWSAQTDRLLNKLQAAYITVNTDFNALANSVDQYISEMRHYDDPKEIEILTHLYQRQRIINALRLQIRKTQTELPMMHCVDKCKALTRLHKDTVDVINRISKVRHNTPQQRYVPFKRQKHETDLLKLRETALNDYIKALEPHAKKVKQRLNDFMQHYFNHLTSDAQRCFSEQTAKIIDFNSQSTLKSQFITGFNRSLSALKTCYEQQVNSLKHIDDTITDYLTKIHRQYNKDISKCIEDVVALPPILINTYDYQGKQSKYVIWQRDKWISKTKVRLIHPKFSNEFYDIQKLRDMTTSTRQEAKMIKERHAALHYPPAQTMDETGKAHQLLHMIYQVLPELNTKLTEILNHLPNNVEKRKADPGFNTILNVHLGFADAIKQFLNDQITPIAFKHCITRTLKSQILNEEKLIQLSAYQNGRLLQWLRSNTWCRRIIRFFTFRDHSSVVAGASQLERDVYDMAKRCEALLEHPIESNTRQQPARLFFHAARGVESTSMPHSDSGRTITCLS